MSVTILHRCGRKQCPLDFTSWRLQKDTCRRFLRLGMPTSMAGRAFRGTYSRYPRASYYCTQRAFVTCVVCNSLRRCVSCKVGVPWELLVVFIPGNGNSTLSKPSGGETNRSLHPAGGDSPPFLSTPRVGSTKVLRRHSGTTITLLLKNVLSSKQGLRSSMLVVLKGQLVGPGSWLV